jgi:5'(3')-deoxyribonucleotidase
MNDKKMIEQIMAIQLEKAQNDALKNQIFAVDNVEEKSIKAINIEEVPFTSGLTLKEVLNDLQNQIYDLIKDYQNKIDILETEIKTLTEALNTVSSAVNTNSTVFKDAINGIREEIEKGTIL